MFGKEPTDNINDSIGATENIVDIDFSKKRKTKFSSS